MVPSYSIDHATDAATGSTVSIAKVTKQYNGTTKRVTALDDITLDIASDQRVAVMGRSGSGKSTLLHLIGAMDIPDTGEINVDGTNIALLRDSQRAAFRRNVGFVFQRFHLLPALTAVDNILAPALPYRKASYDKSDRAHKLLASVGLADRAKHLPANLSGGEQQRVAIARALMNQPRLLLADEPTGNLDTQTGEAILDLLFQQFDEMGLTLIIATHDPTIASRCGRVISLADGKILSDSGC